MALGKTIKRELEVAFSKHSQPIWFRILKYIVLTCFVYFYWSSPSFWIILTIEANPQMVRIIAGTLAEVGTGLRPVASMHDVLEARDRRVAGATAPAQGLTLMAVRYSL